MVLHLGGLIFGEDFIWKHFCVSIFFELIYVGLIFRVFNLTVISVSFTVCNNNKSSVTLEIVFIAFIAVFEYAFGVIYFARYSLE